MSPLDRLQVLAAADAHAASWNWNSMLAVLAIVLGAIAVMGALYLTRIVSDVLAPRAVALFNLLPWRRVPAALAADNARKSFKSPQTITTRREVA